MRCSFTCSSLAQHGFEYQHTAVSKNWRHSAPVFKWAKRIRLFRAVHVSWSALRLFHWIMVCFIFFIVLLITKCVYFQLIEKELILLMILSSLMLHVIDFIVHVRYCVSFQSLFTVACFKVIAPNKFRALNQYKLVILMINILYGSAYAFHNRHAKERDKDQIPNALKVRKQFFCMGTISD